MTTPHPTSTLTPDPEIASSGLPTTLKDILTAEQTPNEATLAEMSNKQLFPEKINTGELRLLDHTRERLESSLAGVNK